jgi:hypothetical protein
MIFDRTRKNRLITSANRNRPKTTASQDLNINAKKTWFDQTDGNDRNRRERNSNARKAVTRVTRIDDVGAPFLYARVDAGDYAATA